MEGINSNSKRNNNRIKMDHDRMLVDDVIMIKTKEKRKGSNHYNHPRSQSRLNEDNHTLNTTIREQDRHCHMKPSTFIESFG